MTQRNENRLRRLESTKRRQPYAEESFDHCTEEELVTMRDAAQAALAGDAEAAAELQRLLALTDAGKGLITTNSQPTRLPQRATIARRSALIGP
jgi:hypothetical protein